ncbi:hypothetical protein FOXYS1_13707 [Fusarium oxysporum]|uniref:Rhodopsin domain-containing protein n=1 Tax=Fusarium oxysporum TaxID=5507 RepID=A0A8H4ZZY9_FUSOX|nr:hypothetical protein FOXYS1_13707 [Fusarium oxysporum]
MRPTEVAVDDWYRLQVPGSYRSSAFVDFYLALYPATVLWQLQMALRKKLVLTTALGFGICAGSVAIYKSTTIPGTAEKTDFTFVAENLVIWVSIEANCVIMAACIPILMPLAELIFGKNFLSNGPSSIKGLTSFLKKMSAHTKMSSIEMMSQTARREIAVNQRGVESQESILPRVEAGLKDGCNNIIRTDRIEIGDKNRREDGESIRGRDRP